MTKSSVHANFQAEKIFNKVLKFYARFLTLVADRLAEIAVFTLAPPCGALKK